MPTYLSNKICKQEVQDTIVVSGVQPLFMYQFDLESLARAHAYLGTDVA